MFVCVFLFKQKTAYEMRISDWSSDVCSSDLRAFARCCTTGRYEPATSNGVGHIHKGLRMTAVEVPPAVIVESDRQHQQARVAARSTPLFHISGREEFGSA